jgi:hypothetical protein
MAGSRLVLKLVVGTIQLTLVSTKNKMYVLWLLKQMEEPVKIIVPHRNSLVTGVKTTREKDVS